MTGSEDRDANGGSDGSRDEFGSAADAADAASRDAEHAAALAANAKVEAESAAVVAVPNRVARVSRLKGIDADRSMLRTAGRRRSVPGIEDVELVKALEVLEVSRHDGHLVNQGCGADESIAERRWIGYV